MIRRRIIGIWRLGRNALTIRENKRFALQHASKLDCTGRFFGQSYCPIVILKE